MSTKIYAAYRYKGTIYELLEELKGIRESYYKESYSILKSAFYREYRDSDDKVRKAFEFSKQIKEAMKNISRDPLARDASAIVYFYHRRIYVQFFIDRYGEPEGLSEKFEDYHYQNQTDKPDEISERAWRQREKAWDNIFGESGVPSQSGLLFEIFGEHQLSRFTMDLMEDVR